jgi:glycosyltransferase involved in cell wall biosynthesis
VRIWGLCLVRDEADIIRQTLVAASEWCDAVYVLDNGSNDGTWELVQALADDLPTVVPHARDLRPYSPALRGDLFRAHRHEAAIGDWWCIVDADEQYIDDPRVFLAGVPRRYGQVWSASFEYYLTDLDVIRYREDPTRYADEVPVEEKCRYYINNWSERRCFRHTRRLLWGDDDWPEPLGHVFKRRIRLKHFQYRSPQQIQRRIETRRKALEDGRFLHEGLPNWAEAMVDPAQVVFARSDSAFAPSSWTERVLDHRLLLEDTGDASYEIDEPKLTPIPRPWPAWMRRLRRLLRRLQRSA